MEEIVRCMDCGYCEVDSWGNWCNKENAKLNDVCEEHKCDSFFPRIEKESSCQQLSKALCGKENVTLDELLEEKEQLKQRAETMTINGREIKTAIARRNPADKFDWKKGAAVAFDRLWDSQRKAEKRPEVREVKRYANLGEYIKIVDADVANDENYHNGDILLVVEYYEGKRDGWVLAKGANVVIDPDEYVVLEGYRP